jgi:outer membrane protein TolC
VRPRRPASILELGLALLFLFGRLAGAQAPETPRVLSLAQCIDLALENNRNRAASRLSVEIAEAQFRQAKSADWPQVGLRGAFSRLDENPNFLFPESRIELAPSSFVASTPLGPLPVSVPGQSIRVPEQDIELMDRKNLALSLEAMYPLYTGGLRNAVKRQARSGVDAAKQEQRRTDLQLVYDVGRIYWGAVLSRILLGIGEEALARMEVTLDITEAAFQGGSMKVKKTDYLRTKAVVESLRATVAALRSNEALMLSALTNTLGLDWRQPVAVKDSEIPFDPAVADLGHLVGQAYEFSPDWLRLAEGLKAAAAAVDEKKAGRLPKLALLGRLVRIENAYDKGMVTPANKNSLAFGIALDLPLFNGMRTSAEIAEARARLDRLGEQKVLLREGLALQVKDVFLSIRRAMEQKAATEAAAKAAEENRDLNERAYQQELVETGDVIEAQLMESLLKANFQKTLFDLAEAQARLQLVVGGEVHSTLTGGAR